MPCPAHAQVKSIYDPNPWGPTYLKFSSPSQIFTLLPCLTEATNPVLDFLAGVHAKARGDHFVLEDLITSSKDRELVGLPEGPITIEENNVHCVTS